MQAKSDNLSENQNVYNNNNNNNNNITDENNEMWCDPITFEIMDNAVITPCGHTFSEWSVLRWLSERGTCPLCNRPTKPEELAPNLVVRETIAKLAPHKAEAGTSHWPNAKEWKKKSAQWLFSQNSINNSAENSPLLPGPQQSSYTSYTPRFLLYIMLGQIILFITMISCNSGFEDLNKNPFIGPSINTLDNFQAKNLNRIISHGEWWRIIIPGILNAGLLDLSINLLLCFFLTSFEKIIGSWRVAAIYLVSVVLGTLSACLMNHNMIEVTSSAPIFALLGAAFSMLKLQSSWSQIYSQNRRWLLPVVILCIPLLILSLLPIVSLYAQITGFVSGVFMCVIWLHSFVRSSLQLNNNNNNNNSHFVNMITTRSVRMMALIILQAALVAFIWLIAKKAYVTDCHFCENVDCLSLGQKWCSYDKYK